MKRAIHLFFLIFSILIGAISARGQEPNNQISEPSTLALGDSFIYQGFNSLDNAKSGSEPTWTRKDVVTEIKPNGDFVMKAGEDSRIFNREGNLFLHAGGNGKRTEYKPFLPTYRYPMRIGQSYPVEFSRTWGNNGDAHFKGTAEVIGWEEVTVPAGTFKAMRIEVSGSFSHPPRFAPASFKRTTWVSPETKMRAVLFSEERRWNGGSQSFVFSLKSFSLN